MQCRINVTGKEHEVELPPFLERHIAEAFAEAMGPVEMANERIKSFLAFIKTFDEKEFSTICLACLGKDNHRDIVRVE
jgi:hypothetical protein